MNSTSVLSGNQPRIDERVLPAILIVIGILGVSFGVVHFPFVIAGAVLGALVLSLALVAPLLLVALTLMIGPVDLSFVTGGFKSLLPGMGGLDMNGIRLLGATAGFTVYVLFNRDSRNAALGSLGRMWLLFLAFGAATLALSVDPLGGLRLYLKLAYPFLTFLIVIGVANTRERVDVLMKYTLLAAAAITLVINPIFALNGGYRMDAGHLRVGGVGIGDNPFAFYNVAMLLIVFTRFVTRLQPRYLLFSIVLVMWIALTQTRIAAAAAITGLAVIGLMAAFVSGNRRVVVLSVAAAVVVGMVVVPQIMLRSLGFVPTPSEFFRLIRNPLTLYESINWEGRQLLWAILWGAFMHSPIIGLGLGTSGAVIRETFPDQSVQVAHNEYMRLATDMGLVGVVLFAVAVCTWLVHAVRISRDSDSDTREYAFPAIAGMIAWAIISATDNAFDYYTVFTQYIGFLMAGAVVYYATRHVPTEVHA